jgi:hypothetical protein
MENPLNDLLNLELASVEFVRDYIQLRFDGPVLTKKNDPVLRVSGQKITRETQEFANFLIGCIGNKVIATRFIESEIAEIVFDSNIILFVSLRPQDYITVNALIFDGKEKGHWIW